ncbi:hypothetical protein ACWDBW_32910 [Streptomyces sp. NPDC001107]
MCFSLASEERQIEILRTSTAPGVSRRHLGSDPDFFDTTPQDWTDNGPEAANYQWLRTNRNPPRTSVYDSLGLQRARVRDMALRADALRPADLAARQLTLDARDDKPLAIEAAVRRRSMNWSRPWVSAAARGRAGVLTGHEDAHGGRPRTGSPGCAGAG